MYGIRCTNGKLGLVFNSVSGAGMSAKGGAIAQRPRLALYRRDVVLPVVAHLPAIDQPVMAGDHDVAGDHADPVRIEPGADHVPGELATR